MEISKSAQRRYFAVPEASLVLILLGIIGMYLHSAILAPLPFSGLPFRVWRISRYALFWPLRQFKSFSFQITLKRVSFTSIFLLH
jgi:hypothetical protein